MKEIYDVEAHEPRPEGPSAILILLDGTWNDETGKGGDGVVTNVVKLYRCLEQDAPRQVVRYFRGVGNDEDVPGVHGSQLTGDGGVGDPVGRVVGRGIHW